MHAIEVSSGLNHPLLPLYSAQLLPHSYFFFFENAQSISMYDACTHGYLKILTTLDCGNSVFPKVRHEGKHKQKSPNRPCPLGKIITMLQLHQVHHSQTFNVGMAVGIRSQQILGKDVWEIIQSHWTQFADAWG